MDSIIYLKAVEKDGEVILHLKDNEGHEHDKAITTFVDPGSNVTWILMEDSNIIQITGISTKENSMNIFSTKPHPIEGSKDWEAVVGDLESGKESYYIDFRYKDGKEYRDDPDVDIKPPTK